ncbi:hypothetical protein QQ045_019048 [Rhodiola kirilowii]
MASNGDSSKKPPTPSPLRNSKFFQANMRILVTGGAGFIGSHLVDRLMENEKNEKERLTIFLKRKTPSSASEDCDSTANTSNIVPQGSSALEYVDLNDLPWDPANRFLLNQGFLFRGHDESEESNNQGNFMELIKYTASLNQSINNVVLGKAHGNNQMVCPKIQKDIVHCFSQEVIRRIIEEIGDDVFPLLGDESSDVSYKEQMVVILHFVDKYEIIKERFIGVIHVKHTSSMNLKSAIDSLFSEYGLSLKSVRGQGYDGARNMKGEFNILRALISQENSSAYYVHYFAHQLQLVVVAISKKHFEVGDF